MSETTALNALHGAYVELGEVYRLTDEELLAIPGFGKTCLAWLREKQAADGVPPTSRKLIKIHAPVFRIIRELGLTPDLVKEMTIRPREVEVTLYRINEDGHKFIDLETYEPAIEKQTFDVVTSEKTPKPPAPFDFLDVVSEKWHGVAEDVTA